MLSHDKAMVPAIGRDASMDDRTGALMGFGCLTERGDQREMKVLQNWQGTKQTDADCEYDLRDSFGSTGV